MRCFVWRSTGLPCSSAFSVFWRWGFKCWRCAPSLFCLVSMALTMETCLLHLRRLTLLDFFWVSLVSGLAHWPLARPLCSTRHKREAPGGEDLDFAHSTCSLLRAFHGVFVSSAGGLAALIPRRALIPSCGCSIRGKICGSPQVSTFAGTAGGTPSPCFCCGFSRSARRSRNSLFARSNAPTKQTQPAPSNRKSRLC